MREYRKFESDGRFGVSITNDACGITDDLGSGRCDSTAVFPTAQCREYFILAAKSMERADSEASRYERLVNALRDAVKHRNVRKRILELIK